MNVMYLLCRENIYSPLVEGQVIKNLKLIAMQSEIKVYFVWLKRIDYYFLHRKQIAESISQLECSNIQVVQIPILIGKFPLSSMAFYFLKKQVISRLKKIILKHKIDFIHTRGYNSGLLAAELKKTICIKHLFDPRSPYLSEIRSTYAIKDCDAKFSFWQNSEREIISSADAVVGVSEDFCDYLKKMSNHVYFIPNNVDMTSVETIRSWVVAQKRKSICYVGSLGYGWNDVREYIRLMKKILSFRKDILFELYVVRDNIPIVKEEIEKNGISKDSILLDSLPREKIIHTIAGCLAGMQIMSKRDCRLGVKTVDYLAAGLPILCNDNAVGAAKLVERNGFGWNIDSKDIHSILSEIELFDDNIKCVRYAEQNFSTKSISQKYQELYKSLYDGSLG